jgi:hypothetical protein
MLQNPAQRVVRGDFRDFSTVLRHWLANPPMHLTFHDARSGWSDLETDDEQIER